jgi:hypothetical protein
MKKLFIIIAALFLVVSCEQSPPQGAYHEVRIDPVTGQQVVYVQQADGTNYFLDYVLFNSLFNSGGYGSVYGYYNTHTVYIRSYSTHYSNYRPSSRYYGKTQDRAFRPSSPSMRNTTPATPSSPSSTSSYRPSSPSSRPSAPSSSSYRSSSPSSRSSSSHHR